MPATNPATAARTKKTDGAQAAGESGVRKRSSRITCAAAIATMTAAALYFVDVAKPPRSPATAKPRSVARLTRGAATCVSIADASRARQSTTSAVISTSVIAKCESLTCRTATARKKAAARPAA